MVFSLASKDSVVGISDPLPSDFTPSESMPIYWEESVSDLIVLLDDDGVKIGHKIVTSGAGYTTTDFYNLAGDLTKTFYQSMYGDWYETTYETITSAAGEKQIVLRSSGKSGDYSWQYYQLTDSDYRLIESSFEASEGSYSITTQKVERASDGTVLKFIFISEGSSAGNQYYSYSEYDANFKMMMSRYSDSEGNSSRTETVAVLGPDGKPAGYSTSSSATGPGGSWFESLEVMDENDRLIANFYKDSSGYFYQRKTTTQEDPIWGSVILVEDVHGNEGVFKSTHNSTAKYTQAWQAIESEHQDSYGYSSKLTTSIKTSAAGVVTYVQHYQLTYPDGTLYQSTTEYNAQWSPLLDGQPVEQLSTLWKTPEVASAPVSEIVPVTEKTAVDEFKEAAKSSSDVVSDLVVTGVKGQQDKLRGTDGDDVFMINDKADSIIYGQAGDSDFVMTQDFSLSLRLKTWDGIENAMLVGSADLNLTGDTGPNVLSGNGGNNILGGAAGADTLFGGGGADTFVVTNDKTFDQIIDFVSGEDKIALSGRAFRSLFISGNQLKEGVFGEKLKLDVDGGLWFDSDGSGRKAAVKVATIGVTASLEMDDFVFLA